MSLSHSSINQYISNVNLKKLEGNSLLTRFLALLNVKHTVQFANKYFNEHPNKQNLLGLSQMLTDYNIDNVALVIKDKDKNILEIEPPFIAYVGSEFTIVREITSNNILYIWQGEYIELPISQFCEIWSGIVLLAEPNDKSVEPNFKEHRQKYLLELIKKCFLFFASCFLFIFLFATNYTSTNVGIILLIVLNLAGIGIASLLLLKQKKIYNSSADRICNLLKQGSCSDVLESNAAKIFGIIGWSEVGLGYFITNLLIVLVTPNLLLYLAIANILSLPYTLWSVWYQKSKVKQWCALCLVVQLILWFVFIVNLVFGFISIIQFSLMEFIFVGCIYSVVILSLNLLISKLHESNKVEQITQELNSIKATEGVLELLLKKQPFYEVSGDTSSILWGNPNADILITVFTNPHCDPCAKMHDRLGEIIENAADNVCIQYVFSSFSEKLKISNKFLLAIYFNKENQEVNSIFKEWFQEGRFNKERFFDKYKVEINSPTVQEEFKRHEIWREQSGLTVTPTVLVNGHKLPDNIKIEDVIYFFNENDRAIVKLQGNNAYI